MMRLWPGRPLELNASTSRNLNISLRVGGVLMADNVGGVVLAGGMKPLPVLGVVQAVILGGSDM